MSNGIILERVTLQELQEMFSNVIESKIESLKPAKQDGDEARLLTRKETAETLRISLPTLADWTRQGFLHAINIRRRVFYSYAEIQRLLKEKGGKHI